MAFGGYLQANTAVDLMVGPFIDETNGKDAETGLTITQAEVRLSKNGANIAQKNEATSLTHDELGNYQCKLDTTDTNTEGILTLMVHESGALPIKMDYMVLAQAAFISLVTAKDTGFMDVDIKAISTDTTAADNLELFTEVLENGTGLIDTGTFKAGAVDANAIGADAITAAKIADDAIAAEHIATGAIVAATFAANAITSTVVADNTITAAKINADAITAAKIADDAIAAEHLAAGAIVAATFAANAITSTVVADNTITAAKLNADCITNAKIADDAFGAENFATDSISADALAADAVNEIWAKAMTDLAQGAPSATASVLTAINYLFEAWRNKTTTTATLITVMKDDASTGLVKSTISDDATTFTKGEFISGA